VPVNHKKDAVSRFFLTFCGWCGKVAAWANVAKSVLILSAKEKNTVIAPLVCNERNATEFYAQQSGLLENAPNPVSIAVSSALLKQQTTCLYEKPCVSASFSIFMTLNTQTLWEERFGVTQSGLRF